MNSTFIYGFVGILVFMGVLIYAFDYMAKSPKYARYRIRPFEKNRYSDAKRTINTHLNSIMSALLYVLIFYYFSDYFLYESFWPGLATLLGEVLGTLLLYDFLYYFYHRAAHHPKMMRYMHGVHHHVRNPTAGESTYLNPLEPIGAIIILFVSTWIVGPISSLGFLLVFFVYALTNVIVHCSLIFPHPAFRLFNFWVRAHDAHHQSLKFNYSNIFPFWDQMFGTYIPENVDRTPATKILKRMQEEKEAQEERQREIERKQLEKQGVQS